MTDNGIRFCARDSLSNSFPNPGRRGIVLVLVSGLLVLMGLLAVSLFHMARFSASSARVLQSRARASLAAASGMEYAAARLARDSFPCRSSSAEARGEDWTFRDGPAAKLAGAANPSYAHGESWSADSDLMDADGLDNDGDGTIDEAGERDGLDNDGDGLTDEGDETDGIYARPETAGPDLDQNGRFSAWSGRLRGTGGGPYHLRFALKIESPEGKLPLNAGVLTDTDDLGATFVSTDDFDVGGNGIRDYHDPNIPYHRSLVHAINNLAVLVGVTTRREDKTAANPDDPIRICWLGLELIENRPVGGYKTMDDVRRTMVTTLGYAPLEYDAVAPYLALDLYAGLGESGRGDDREGDGYPAYAPVNLWCAPQPVLESLFRYLMGTFQQAGDMSATRGPFPGEAGCWAKPSTRVINHNFFTIAIFGSPVRTPLLIFPDEAKALARKIMGLRNDAATSLSWSALHRKLMGDAVNIFKRDADDLNAAVPPPPILPTLCPVAAANWTQAKAKVAYEALTMDPYPFPVSVGEAAWAFGWQDVPSDPEPPIIGASNLFTVVYPDAGWNDPTPWGAGDLFTPYLRPGGPIRAQGGTLAPPSLFRVSSLGTAGRQGSSLLEGTLRAHEILELTSQEDFENLSGGPHLAARGIRVSNDLPAPFDPRPAVTDTTVSPNRIYPAVASLPCWNRRSLTSAADGSPYYGFSRIYGALGLASREIGIGSAAIYWPLQEQYDFNPDTDRQSEPNPPTLFSCPFTSDSEGQTPYGVTTSTFDVNQVSGPQGPFLGSHWVEFWGCSGSFFHWYYGDFPGSPWVGIEFSIEELTGPAGWITEFTLTQKKSSDPNYSEAYKWPLVPTNRGNLHIVLALDGTQGMSGRMIYTLYVNGQPLGGGSPPMQALYSAGMPSQEKVNFHIVDEVRLYNVPPSFQGPQAPPSPQGNYDLGRYVIGGTYTSPLYAPDGPCTLLSAQWTGIVPMSLRDANSQQVDPFRVEVHAYANPDGTGAESTAILWDADPATIDDSKKIYDLAGLGLGSCRSFRYVVRFDCSSATKFIDTPIFDSVWFSLRRSGRTGWASWLRR